MEDVTKEIPHFVNIFTYTFPEEEESIIFFIFGYKKTSKEELDSAGSIRSM